MVVRTPHGGNQSAGPQHSQCLEAWLAHVPGLVVVSPATVEDSYGLLRASIDSPNPVVFVENKALYGLKGRLPDAPVTVPIGKARVARGGRDVSVIAYGGMVHEALRAAETLAAQGIDTEVVDLRTLQPWDRGAVLASVQKTHRAVIAHEAVMEFGAGAEIAAWLADDGFDELDGPIVRVGAAFAPVPFAPALEKRFLPHAEDVVKAVQRALGKGGDR
jgi:pyruvate/2-oxoglutarate/acetoin dehydrogenase E1 component